LHPRERINTSARIRLARIALSSITAGGAIVHAPAYPRSEYAKPKCSSWQLAGVNLSRSSAQESTVAELGVRVARRALQERVKRTT